MVAVIRSQKDNILKLIVGINGFFTAFAVGLIFFFLLKESYLALSGSSTAFIFDKAWYPTEGQFNMIPMITGSLAVTGGAILIALPLGLFSAFLSSFYLSSKANWFFKRLMELYTGIPSVIFGFWGLMKIVPLINEINPPGQSLLAGILILALMIFPILTLSLISAFEMSSKRDYKVSGSLGISTSTYIWKVLLPTIKPQLGGALLLSVGRAIGETMAVLMVCGNIVQVPGSVFDPIRTLTSNIALEMAYAVDGHRSALFLTGLILMIMVTFLFYLKRLLR